MQRVHSDIRRNDTVKVITGRDQGKQGRVLRVFPEEGKVLVEHVMMGRLSPRMLGLRVPVYDSNVHYQQVRDTWAGVRTPDGR